MNLQPNKNAFLILARLLPTTIYNKVTHLKKLLRKLMRKKFAYLTKILARSTSNLYLPPGYTKSGD
jgi:hypothetical protein